MLTVSPTFYGRFRCLADRCDHSCCRGWEIDIDPASARRYLAWQGPLGDRARRSIGFDGDGYSFRLTADDRCPFLAPTGLCEIVMSCGQDALCDICREHPRFYEEVGGAELRGLGLSCEAVVALLLEEPSLRFTDGEREFGLAETVERLTGLRVTRPLCFRPSLSDAEIAGTLRLFARTEPIDEAWTRQIEGMLADVEAVRSKAVLAEKGRDAAAYDRVLQYILYRQLERLPETGLDPLVRYAQVCAQQIFLTAACEGSLAEAVRRFSEQIEYSTENVDILLDGLSSNGPAGV